MNGDIEIFNVRYKLECILSRSSSIMESYWKYEVRERGRYTMLNLSS